MEEGSNLPKVKTGEKRNQSLGDFKIPLTTKLFWDSTLIFFLTWSSDYVLEDYR